MRRLAPALGALGVALTILGSVAGTWVGWVGPGDLFFAVLFGSLGIACSVTGAVVAGRIPSNAVGWLILGMGLGTGVLLAANAYAEVGVDTSIGPLPLEGLAAWVGGNIGVATFFGLPGFLLLLFPTGHLPSPRWRWFAWSFAVLVTTATFSYGMLDGTIEPGVENPLGLDGSAARIAQVVADGTDIFGLPGMVACAAALVVRLRRSRGLERTQLKWFTYAATVAGFSTGSLILLGEGLASDIALFMSMVSLTMLPVTAGVAILRHRLYDIDVVIKRTLVYSTLTVTLVATYLLLVLGLQAVLRPLAGDSDLAVAASTLAVAALFGPLRGAIQNIVDRRFFRSRYDATRAVNGFATRLRNELDLETLGSDLRAVVRDTVQPEHVSLWLRNPGATP